MKKLLSNFKYVLMNQVLLMLMPFITAPHIARTLGPNGIGVNAYISSVVNLFALFSVLSIPVYGIRQIAQCENKKDRSKVFFSIYFIQLIMSISILIFFVVYMMFQNEHQQLFLIYILHLLAMVFDVTWFFNGREQVKKVAVRNMWIKVIGAALIFLFVRNNNDLDIFIWISVSVILLGQLVLWIPLRKEIKFEKIRISDVTIHIVPISILFLPQLLTKVYMLVNGVILGNISGTTELGFYNHANMIIQMALGIVSSISIVMLPRMSMEFAKGNIDNFKKFAQDALQFVFFLSIPMMLGLIAITSNFVAWFFGPEFAPVSSLSMIIAPKIIFVGMANVLGIQILVATNQQNKYLVSIGVASLLSLAINLSLVYSFGAMATALALVAAEGIGVVIQFFYTKKFLNLKFILRELMKYSTGGILMYLSINLISETINTTALLLTIIQVIVGIIVYLSFLLIMKDSFLLKIFALMRLKSNVKSYL